MAKRSDFAQKLLDDLRLRKERMAASNRSNQSHHLPIDAYAYTKQTYRGSRNTKGNEIVSSRSGEMVSRRQGSGELMSNMQQVIPYGRKGQSQRSGNMSQALAFAFENGSGKLTRADFSYTNSIMGFLHQINKRGTMELGISSEIRGLSNLDRQLAASTLSLGQINEISKGAQKLNHILRACSNGLNMDTYSLQFAKELLQGAIDLEESLRMLMVTRQAHNKNRITLLEEEDQDDEDDDDRMRMGGMQLARPSQVVGMQRPITLTRNSKSNVKRSSTSSNQTDNKGRIPNVIAKLMGLDNLPVPEKVEMGSGGNGNGNTHKTSKHTATKTEVVVQDRIKALKGFDKASIKADRHIRSSAQKSLTRETETYVQVIGRKQNHPDNREQKGTMKGRSTNDPVLNIKSSIQVEKEINGSIIQPEKRHSNKHTLSNDNNKSRNHVGVQKSYSYILSKFGPQEDQMLMMRPPKNSSKSPHQWINPQKKQPPSILVRNVAAVKSYDDPDLVRDGASNDTNEKVKQVISNRKLGQISSPRDQKFERANGIKTLKDEKHVHKLASKKTKNTTRKQKVDQMLNGRKLDIVKQQEASDRASGNGAEQARVGVSNEPITVAVPVPVRCQAHKEAELPPAPALFSSGSGGELHTRQQSANVLRCQDVKSVTINLQDQAVPEAADEGFKTGEVALQHKSTNGGIQGRVNHSEVENQNICEISIQQPLTESENCLKWTLVMSQSFVNTAEALFRLNIPFSVLQGGHQDSHQDEGNKLILDCGYEVMKRKGIRQELRVHTCSFNPVLNIRSLDDLVRQLNEDMEKLQFYGRKRCAQVGVEDYLPKMLEHDVNDKYPDIDCMWDFGWNNETFAFIEKYDVVRDTEKHILSVLLDEITKDCCISTRIEYENHTLNGRELL